MNLLELYNLLLEAIEDTALLIAIKESEFDDNISQDELFAILEGRDESCL